MLDEPTSREELSAIRRNARERLRLWQKRVLYSIGALLLSCALVYLFLDGSPLHGYWDSFGKYLLLVAMASLL